MSEKLFGIDLGLQIEDDLGNEVAIIPSNGIPGGTTESDGAPKGSLALDYTTGDLYTKISSGSGSSAWQKLDAGLNQISWREPVVVKDDTAYANLAAATTAASSGTLDGVTISAGDRILFTNITGSPKNVYVWDGTNLVADTNTESSGDTIYVEQGTSGGKQFTYDGTNWVLSNQASLDELGYIRAFIGKNAAGNELPAYSSNNFVADGDTLETAIGKLDTQVQSNLNAINSITNLQTEVDNIESSVGLNPDGTFSSFSGTNFLDSTTSIKGAITSLDTQLGVTNSNINTLQGEVDNIESGVGLDASGNYSPPAGSNYLGSTTSVLNALGALDAQVFTNAGNITTNTSNITSAQAEIDNIETALGLNTDGTFNAYSGTNYIDSATSQKNADELLDAQIKTNADAIASLQTQSGDEANIRAFIGKGAAGVESPNYSSAEVVTQGSDLESAIGALDQSLNRAYKQIDTLGISGDNTFHDVTSELVDDVKLVHWEVYVTEPATGKVNTYDVVATHDGTTTSDATDWDYTVSHKMRVGGHIAKGRVKVVLTGSGASQALKLKYRSRDNPVDVHVIRRIII